MLILLAMFVLSNSSLGVPLSGPAVTLAEPLNCDLTQCAVAAADADIHPLRSRYAIIQTCLATLFICVWQSSHPNIVDLRQPGLKRIAWRFLSACGTLIAPEVVLVVALEERIEASKIAHQYNTDFLLNVPKRLWWQSTWESTKAWFYPLPNDATRYDYVEPWTTSHGFFIQMGGFQLYKDNYPSEKLDYDRFSELLRSGHIDPPHTYISTRDLEDRSKGDAISKSIAIFQTSWFILQCFVRLGQHLPLSELEIFTLASAVLNGAIYAADWDKPQGAGVAIRLPWKDGYSVEQQTSFASNQPCEGSMEQQRSCAPIIPMQSLGGPNITQGADGVVNPDRNSTPTNPSNRSSIPLLDHPRNQKLPVIYFPNTNSERMHYSSALRSMSDSRAAAITCIAGSVFGAIHFFAWGLEFPTKMDQITWHICTVGLTCIPILLSGSLIMGKWADLDEDGKIT
ncbi:hypothetical protein D9619_011055 [Psilocybe cf. subviscida]|uniref:Uncharacterized protein n=1 Tax=Psilocybe cf. subviscida TaxID=2480587 RepID=A0A8H5B8K5_9AGAR|nr:hypothetical protein D9619_011055 [Psilocybe cf. subviscida]